MLLAFLELRKHDYLVIIYSVYNHDSLPFIRIVSRTEENYTQLKETLRKLNSNQLVTGIIISDLDSDVDHSMFKLLRGSKKIKTANYTLESRRKNIDFNTTLLIEHYLSK